MKLLFIDSAAITLNNGWNKTIHKTNLPLLNSQPPGRAVIAAFIPSLGSFGKRGEEEEKGKRKQEDVGDEESLETKAEKIEN